ncbi:membrane protein [Salinisphaera orenii MK-B5]|uniref:Membrane protein n=2 Tax=Salinisphaera orenii TaxID=856731 RepID=A0A423PR64_9GAMM|nr:MULTISPECIES: DUF1269 domain-containing protein [Salinisphaera]ROO25232.1 membrane protein [Salinisphaera halophila YIM 95161]ROO28001.1 membrane protein [Salinisphaera orenii MK-B5]
MKRRLYFLLPDIETTQRVVDDLLLARVTENDMYVVAREDAQTRDLPQAGVSQTSDLAGSAERGAAAGGVTGVLAGLAAMAFPPAGIAVGGGMVAATGLGGAGFGAWVSSMIGIRHNNAKVEQYEQAIRDGRVLMMVDVDDGRVDEIQNVVRDNHPDARIEGTDPHKPAFP